LIATSSGEWSRTSDLLIGAQEPIVPDNGIRCPAGTVALHDPRISQQNLLGESINCA
jgi:hypothetical protein